MDIDFTPEQAHPNIDPTTSLVLDTFRSCWESFYGWKQTHDVENLSSLMRDVDITDDPASPQPTLDIENSKPQDPYAPTFSVAEYNSDGEPAENYTLNSEDFEIEPIQPHPNYASCTPISRSIIVGDDSNYMPFIPYSDDPEFNYEAQIEHYGYFAWQILPDPDLEVICVQTVKYLMNDHGLALQQIIDTKVMPPDLIGKMTTYLGARRRDYPEWPPEDPLHAPNVPYEPPYADPLPSQILDDLLLYFCSNRNCLHSYCTVHSGEMELPPPIPPTLTNEALNNSVTEPCSKYCFILGRHSNTLSYWSEEDTDLLYTTLKYAPDSLPCDLAVIVCKPCKEVATRRRGWFASQTQPPQAPLIQPKSRKNMAVNQLQFQDFDSDNFTPNYPCSHPGPCDASTSCPCALNSAHCIGACKCSKKCIRKWRGCMCTKSRSNKTCGTDRCPCFRAHRECDPDICAKCEARDPTSDVCKNAAIQHMRHKRGVVYRSKWGLGFYLAEPVHDGDLITEYIGDLIYDATVRSRDQVGAHVNRQYVFNLNSTLSIDGGPAGNESRYINHAPGDQANVRAYVRLVNGEHRIGIFAVKDVAPGSELLIDYGSDFFHNHPASTFGSLPSTSQTVTQPTPAATDIVSPQVLSLSFFQPQQPQSPTPQGGIRRNTKGKGKAKERARKRRRYLTDLSLEDGDDGDDGEYKGPSDEGSGSGSDL
ncbi:SET domain-containing protein [Macrolepiota fuliginosa MF-IS2]|uniref:SET domain-containing protein n=1 Tax=Macrolepiota fuliginosa MF-IS2 TaxID=1400762 RepID=A0A9P5X084_9AGAR|nr:SET domain-containing protein [Macrolepiota fuliginosa MF-IS2]